MTDARTVAMLARKPSTSLDEATAMIERYARTFAAEAAFKATERVCEKVRRVAVIAMNAPLTSQQRADELLAEHQEQRAHLHDAERIPDVGSSE